MEIPLEVVDSLYNKVNPAKNIHSEYSVLRWKDFCKIKREAYYLYQAGMTRDSPKSAMTDLDWYEKLFAVYSAQQSLAEVSAAVSVPKPKFSYPYGTNIQA